MGFKIENGVLKNYEEEPGITEITIPDGVTSIGKFSFDGCQSLTSVVILDAVTSIGECAFRGCSSLTSITLPDSVTSIGDSAFCNCKSLTSIVIPDSVTSIGGSAFYDCSSLTSVVLPDGITSIDKSTFAGTPCYDTLEDLRIISNILLGYCGKQTEVVIPNFVTCIGERAFENRSSLTSITVPDSVTSIGESAFEGCSRLTSIVIPETVTCIGQNAFSDCSSLTSVIVSNGITSIGENAFWGTPWYDALGDLRIVGNVLLECCGNQTVAVIPDSVTSVGECAFADCNSLKSIVFPLPWERINEIWPQAKRYKIKIIRGFCEHDDYFKDPELHAEYRKMIVPQKKTLVPAFIEEENLHALQLCKDAEALKNADFLDEMILLAADKGKTSAHAMLADYKNRTINP